MGLDRVRADAEFSGNLFGLVMPGDQAQDFFLALGKRFYTP